MFTVVDIECTYQGVWNSDTSDATPFNSLNKLVSVGYRTTTGESNYLIFNHKDLKDTDTKRKFDELQDVLSRSKLLIGHNLKFDLLWLYSCGFKYTGKLYDTMIFEYVQAKGLKKPLALAEVLDKLGLPKKLDILQTYCGEQGMNVDEVPIPELTEYGMADINGTYALFQHQTSLLKSDDLTKSTSPVLKLMNEFLTVLIDVEHSGIAIDSAALDSVEQVFREQKDTLEIKIKAIIQKVMGHTPININSPEQISWVLHSKKVTDKATWATLFNLGSEERNGVKKAKYVKKYPDKIFRQIIRSYTQPVYKTVASQCPDCMGHGYIQLYRKDGLPRKKKNVCHTCKRTGIIYTEQTEIAGFKIPPISSEYAATGGFSSSKEVLDDLLSEQISNEAREFIQLLKEYNAVTVYLASFVDGIRTHTRPDGLLHTNFNQCVTATGRLSSTRPNLQNSPRESTFPIRKVFTSRWQGGMLLSADFAQLEFRVAACLAQCENAMQDILNKVDVHKQTAEAITKAGEPTTRQDAKKSTFRPLYGGTSGSPAQLAYFDYFFKRYNGIFNWHNSLCEQAVKFKYIQTPSGRIYAFPNAEVRRNGSVSFHTQIKNYPVQGFATGDILPVTMIEIYNLMKEQNVKSLLVLTVHDSIVADIYPGEKDIMIEIFREGFKRTQGKIKERFNYDFNIPLDFDLEIGYNLLNKEKIK